MAQKTMQAWQFKPNASQGLDKALHLNVDAPIPRPAKGQVLIKISTMAVNPVDFEIAEFPIVSRLSYSASGTPGLDFSGTVVESNGHDFTPGTKVFGRLNMPQQHGTMAQYIVAGKEIAQLPDGVDIDAAGSSGTAALTAYQCLKTGGAGPGKKVFINGGSGGVGVWSLQLAKAMGCAEVTTSCSTRNVELCKRLGADVVIDYTKQDLTLALKNKQHYYDMVIDNVGSPAPLYKAADAYLKPGSKYVQIGAPISLAGTYGLLSRMLWPTFLGGGKNPFVFFSSVSSREDLNQIGQWLKEKKIEAIIDRTIEWENAPEAYRLLKAGKAQGKIIVHVEQ